MKKLLFILTMALTLLISNTAKSQHFVNRNGDERFGYNLTTTDSEYHYIDSVTLNTNEGGIITVTVVGYAKDTAYCVTGQKSVRFNKRRGTLTMGTIIDDQAVVTDAALGTATWTLVAASNKIYVRVKGKQSNSITWTSIVKRKSVWYAP